MSITQFVRNAVIGQKNLPSEKRMRLIRYRKNISDSDKKFPRTLTNSWELNYRSSNNCSICFLRNYFPLCFPNSSSSEKNTKGKGYTFSTDSTIIASESNSASCPVWRLRSSIESCSLLVITINFSYSRSPVPAGIK